MKSFGLALSGGGFRACLYHLGVIRFLRDAGLLSQVSHITSVSGGSVVGAHLVLNWDRYCGTDEEFQEVADELLRFLQLDVRNRIVRRFPLTSVANFGRRTLRLGSRRKFTRAGLLEQHYEKYLYGDTGLFSLPVSPRLYILSTNLSEGSVCAFHRDGMLLQRRRTNGHHRFEDITIGLGTVAMSVAASSAFPGFFPPLELKAWEVGAREGDFSRQAFTDGGIYDNIGLRMLHHIEQSLSAGSSHPGLDPSATISNFDGIFVSDAGATFKVRADGRSGGLLSTAMRSSDILMDRVNQLELESFRGTINALFFPITRVVEPKDDPSAPHPEVQRQAALIRTDMDRFSDLEISALVQHGYCVARAVCREYAPKRVGEIPDGPPWRPLAATSASPFVSLSNTEHALLAARQLRKSSSRRIFSTLLSFRDWTTFVWVPLVASLLFALPYLLYESNKTAIQRGYVLTAIAETSPLYKKILSLLETGPITAMDPAQFREATSFEPPDFTGYDVLSDDRIIDLRGWTSSTDDATSAPYWYSRLRVRRNAEATTNTNLRFQTVTDREDLPVHCRTPSLKPKLARMEEPNGRYRWELNLDFSRLAMNDDTEIVFEGMIASESAEQLADEASFQFSILADTGLAQIWMLMPEDRKYSHFEIHGFPIDQPELVETVIPTKTVELPIGSIATFQLINPRHNYRYECRWKWIDESE